MSATDRIRESIENGPLSDESVPKNVRKMRVTAWEAEALCDLADAARRVPDDGRVHGSTHGPSGDLICAYCRCLWPCHISAIRDALARLDRENVPS